MRQRPLLSAAVIYAALALVMFGQGLMPGRLPVSTDRLWQAAPWSGNPPPGVSPFGSNFELSDSITQFQPFLLQTRRTLPDVPLWDPYVMAGRPFLANSQSAVFSPFSLPAYVLPFWHSLALILMLKVFIAALGAFAFGRSLGMRVAGAVAAGTIYGFSQAMVAWASWPHTSTWALLVRLPAGELAHRLDHQSRNRDRAARRGPLRPAPNPSKALNRAAVPRARADGDTTPRYGAEDGVAGEPTGATRRRRRRTRRLERAECSAPASRSPLIVPLEVPDLAGAASLVAAEPPLLERSADAPQLASPEDLRMDLAENLVEAT
jgi:hypothetical protein